MIEQAFLNPLNCVPQGWHVSEPLAKGVVALRTTPFASSETCHPDSQPASHHPERHGGRSLQILLLVAVLASCASAALAETPGTEPPAKTREIFVPDSDLKVLLESEPHRVLLTRQEYDQLVKKAKKSPQTHVPHAIVAVSSDYDITVEEGRARLLGTIVIDVLEEGLHALPLDFGGVGLLTAKLDDQPAPIGYAADGRLNLLVSGQGRHRLVLDMVAPLEMNSAQQSLSFRVTNAAVGRWRLTVPGDVEIKGGAGGGFPHGCAGSEH